MTTRKRLMLGASTIAGLALAGNAVSAEQIASDNTKVPAVLSKTWQFARKTKQTGFTWIPAGSKQFRLDKNCRIDLDTVAGKKGKVREECVIYNEFELKQDQNLSFGAGADWWIEAYLNGEKIFSNIPRGNAVHPCTVNDCLFFGTGKKGRNLLAIMVRRGDASWAFCLEEKPYAVTNPSEPITITADPEKILGKIKPMNAVNNGPIGSSRGRGNMKLWQEAQIPYARNHDAAFCASYGGEHIVDVHAIFPDFSKDPNDPASYDFTLTDRYLKSIMKGGTKVFYRLGSKIEHAPKKYGTRVPPDFKKWAVICEHIIRHYNEGWADGFKFDIQYWEIWNEPDLGYRSKKGSPTWQGTPEQFFELYRITATHLKKCFPKLKIGGPAAAGVTVWLTKFFDAMTAGGKRVPMDFFSWHCYTVDPLNMKSNVIAVRKMMDQYGYTKAESILDEYNYVRGWEGETFNDTLRAIKGIKGAAFIAAVMCAGQDSPLDMLMYYDARPSGFNGMFDSIFLQPLKTYYVFLAWAKLAKLGQQIEVDARGKIGIYCIGASRGGKTGVLISRFFENDQLPKDLPITFTLKKGDLRGVRLYLIDETHDLTEIPYRMDKKGNLLFNMKANSVVFIETI